MKSVSNDYSLVMTILHSQSRISAAIKNNDFHGTLVWDDMNPKKITLTSLPKHAEVSIGDTIITSGFSTVFPYGIEIGTVEDYIAESNKDAFEVDINLFNDIPTITHAYIIKSKQQEEKLEIEEEIEDEL